MEFLPSYVYKKEVDWSLLIAGLTLPVDNQVVFGKIMDRFLQRGERKTINLVLDSVSYPVQLTNENFDKKFHASHKADLLQIRYNINSDFANRLRIVFSASYAYFLAARAMREPNDKRRIRLPEDQREYLAIYTTEYDDTYLLEAITVEDIAETKAEVTGQDEWKIETDMSTADMVDPDATVKQVVRTTKVRKLNRLIGENLKLLYGYRCQLCGELIGEEFGAHICDAHHIDYFVKSMNNDASNQMILCPNHHRIIHETDPVFIRTTKAYQFVNGKNVPLVLNKHL